MKPAGKSSAEPSQIVERGVAEGLLWTVLSSTSMGGQPTTDLNVRGRWISAWGRREDLLRIPLNSHVRVPWKRLARRSSLYLDGDVIVLQEAGGSSGAALGGPKTTRAQESEATSMSDGSSRGSP